MDTDSLYLALADDNRDDCTFPVKKAQRTQISRNECKAIFIDDAKKNFLNRTCCAVNEKLDKREPGLIKEEFRCFEMM